MDFDRLSQRVSPALKRLDPDFDPEFYRGYYPDLAALSGPIRLYRHYRRFGRPEGRFPNARQLYASLEPEFGRLPSNFDPRAYRLMHADLRDSVTNDWAAAEHYLRLGRRQRRAYGRFAPELYRSLYFPGQVITDYELGLNYTEEGRAQGRIGTWSDYLVQEGLPRDDTWVHRLKTDEFALLNGSWAGQVETKLEAVQAMMREGFERLAPLSFDHTFDPAFYREVHSSLKALGDQALYRRWVLEGLATGEAGGPEQQLRQMDVTLRAYPTGFDWRRYLGQHPEGGTNRWSALQHLLKHGLRKLSTIPLTTDEPVAFLIALGDAYRGRDDRSAIMAFEAARATGDRSYTSAHHLADAHFRLQQWRPALALFQEAAAYPDVEVWTYVNGAKAANALGAFRAARALLAAGKATASGEPAWRTTVMDTAEAFFAARTRRARQLYAFEAGRERADRLIARVIEQTAQLWAELDPIGAPMPPAPDGRVVMLANFDIQVCVHYRIEQKAELFELIGRPFEVFPLERWPDFISALPGASAAIFFRIPAWPSVTRAMGAARAMGVPTYYEIDDLVFDAKEYPDTLESYGGLLSASAYEGLLYGVPLFRAAVERCDYAIVSTSPLARATEPLVRSGRAFVLPNGLDSRNEAYLERPPARLRRDDDVMIAYASGTKAHNSDFNELAGPALVELLKQRPKVKLLLVGYLALSKEFDAVRDQVIRFEYVNGSEAFWTLLADADINLAVLKPSWATDSKSEIKWLEAGVMGIPSVVSETAMYREVLEDGVDALIVRDPQEWLEAMQRLVDDAALRRSIGAAARAKAQRSYSLEANARRLEALLAPAVKTRAAMAPTPGGKPRVLLANVWFPPQTIGGATRVVRNNLDAWLDQGLGEAFDFAVVTTDHDVQPPHRVRVDDYRGVPVVRISTPLEPNMDWRPQNPEVGAIFADVLDAWRPDLVHFHAVQRLTASVVEAARLAQVPYLCTVHDAWWLSDYHFLVDEEGHVRPPCEDMPRITPPGVSISQSVDRRRFLRETLEGAQAVLGVSHTFADIHRACGFERTLALPNGLPPMRQVERKSSASGRVRLAHVGNVSKHKGFHLVEAALRQGGFANLALTVIDHGLGAGSVQHRTWGTTPVTFVGRVPQDRIPEFYAETDVLLAPSIWPESFGLVVREALAAGLWVVASDRGAIAEDVQPGVNGFVVDVSTVQGLAAALAEIDAEPQRYLASPATKPALRSAQDQADELMALYREVLGRTQGAPRRAVEVAAPARRKAGGPA